jgi:hypothetical protein
MAFILVCLASTCFLFASAQSKRPFTVADDIAFTHFVPDGYSAAYMGQDGMQFSPNGEFLAVLTAHGRLDLNQVEESLRFYRIQDVEDFLTHPQEMHVPNPVWNLARFGKKEPIVHFRWLGDSSGVAILEHTDGATDQLMLADLRKKTTEVLTDKVAKWGSFAIRDRDHYVYLAIKDEDRQTLRQSVEAELEAPMRVFSGNDAFDLILPPGYPGIEDRRLFNKKCLWAVVDGKRFEVKHEGTPLTQTDFDLMRNLEISRDGESIVTRVRVKDVPGSWEHLYPPPYPGAETNIHAGKSVFQFAKVDLRTGAIHPLTDAPISGEGGWSDSDDLLAWSSDGKSLLISGTFIKSADGMPSRPCVAVVDLASNEGSCVEKLKGRTGPGREHEEGYHYITNVRFVAGDKNLVELNFTNADESTGTIEYRRTPDGAWQLVRERKGIHQSGANGLEITLRLRLDQPPVLVATNRQTSRIIWDPNPQFKDVDLGQVKVYRWKDSGGRNWEGGLYMPAHYHSGQHYPLVIQTHGFSEDWFTPSGSFPTAFVARELASAEIAVLQVGGSKNCTNPEEASCEVAGFESGAKQLAADGIVDLQRGYIGFSHSCWFGMEMLTNGAFPLKATLLADGILVDYFEFALFGIDFEDYYGAKPVGDGLQTWIKRSPGFHLDKVNAPLLIAVEKDSAIEMWQSYSGLRYLKKPVELDLMNTDEHVITNPVERMSSQGLSLDWFRFWLQGYENPDPAKAEQYKRWREMGKLQAENEKKFNDIQAHH